MASNYQVETVCLGVAIDHRIRQLMQPTSSGATREYGSHLSVLNARGREYGCSRAEIDVTAALAGPSTRGGIAVALQQPRGNHPFEKGFNAVIEDCTTLAALGELFNAASCGTLSIRTNVSIIDLLPYVSETEMKQMTDQELANSFKASSNSFCEKQPDVVLCAGKIWLPRPRKYDDRTGEAWKLECIGIGKTFGNRALVRLRAEDRSLIPIHRVNGFHVSYAINYRPHYSCLRQLQLLAVVEACCQVRTGRWEDQKWMQSLRDTCARVVERTSNTASSPRSPQGGRNPGENSAKRMYMYLPDYEKMYSAHLQSMRQIIVSFHNGGIGSDDGSGDLYDRLLDSRLSAMCNDVSLILFEMSRLKTKGWEERFDDRNRDTLLNAARSTVQFAARPRASAGSVVEANPQLKDIFNASMASIDQRVGRSELDLEKASSDFLDMAVKLEALLLQLLEEDGWGRKVQGARDQAGADLTAAMRAMTLGQTAASVRPSGRRNTANTARG